MKRLAIAALCLPLLSSAGYAWNGTNTGSGQLVEEGIANQNKAWSTAAAKAAADAKASSNSISNATGGSAKGGSAQSTARGGTGGSVNNRSGDSVALGVPNVFGMANCGGSISLGGIGGSSGGSGGGMWEFGECKTEREAMTLFQMGQNVAAIALMCSIDRVRDAYEKIGMSCEAETPSPPAPVAYNAGSVAPPRRHFLGWQGPCLPPDIIAEDGSCHPRPVRTSRR